MIIVEWFDHATNVTRRGKLLTFNRSGRELIAVVIAEKQSHDINQAKPGGKIILEVYASFLQVIGDEIPLFDPPS